MVFFRVGIEVRSKAPQSQVVQADFLCWIMFQIAFVYLILTKIYAEPEMMIVKK